MNNQQIVSMKKMILGMFESKPGLREGDSLPPRWLLQTEIINLSAQEKHSLESAFNELYDSELIEISKIEDAEDQKISITQAGVEYITKNKADKKSLRKRNLSQLNIASILEEILPDNDEKSGND